MSKPSYTVYTKDFANMVCRRLERENKKKDKEIEILHSIIKEVREWIVKNSFSNGISSSTFFMPNAYANELLEILNKDSDK